MKGGLRDFLDRPEATRRIGPFRLLRQLGRGGFAPVWLAEEAYGDTVLRTAAVKLFSFDDLGVGTTTLTGPSRERILEEARALCRVEHPNVVRFYALPTEESLGIVGLAMEHVAGRSLDERLALVPGRKLPFFEILSLGLALGSALTVVHQAGLIHRDIKPANVIDAGGIYKLIDFGIVSGDTSSTRRRKSEVRQVLLGDIPIEASETRASALGAEEGGAPGLPSGTLGYVDPESMADNKPGDPRSDLYGLGALLFECATGRLPALLGEGELKHLSPDILFGLSKAPALESFNLGLPSAFCQLVDSLLEPARKDRPKSAEQVTRELERLRQELQGRKRSLPDEEVGPFRGLGRFEELDRDVFFGRGAEIAGGLEVLRSRSLLCLVGPSGSGKSSLGRAGIVPSVLDGALGRFPASFRRVILTPGPSPWETLLSNICPLFPDDNEGTFADTPEKLADFLLSKVGSHPEGLLLFVDQLEELATVSEANSRSLFVALLCRLGERRLPGLRVIVALRRDLLDPIYALSNELGSLLSRGTLLVSPMTDAAWGDALDQALDAYNYRVEDAPLRAEIARDLRETATAMPLVQFALTQIWRARDKQARTLTRRAYEEIGGLRGALERHAESTLEALSSQVAFAIPLVHEMLLELTSAQGTRVTRTQESLVAACGPNVPKAITCFEEARLLIREPEGYTLAHEALLTQWKRLREWVEAAREDRLLGDLLERDALSWEARRDPSMLWRGGRLAVLEELRKKGLVRLSEAAIDFADASKQEAQRAQKRLRMLVAVMAIALVSAIVALVSSLKREGKNTIVREAEARAASDRDNALRARNEALTDKATVEWERDQCKALVERQGTSRKKADEALIALPDQDALLARHCRELKRIAVSESEAPLPLGASGR